MNWKIKQIGVHPAISYAVDELIYYVRQVGGDIRTSRMIMDALGDDDTDALYIGCDENLNKYLPTVEDPHLDDAIYMDVEYTSGIITGSNPRSVLIAVYRFLREIGFAFPLPGRSNDRIPMTLSDHIHVQICEAASYRHREVCIEGADSYDHVADMIDWLPKVALNGYFVQFTKPYCFFRQWYDHTGNPYMPAEKVSDEDIDGMYAQLRTEIKKRDLLFHAVGHSWTCEPYGVPGTGWDVTDEEPPSSIRSYLAEVNGKRGWWGGVPLNTNLCYSDPTVRATLTDAITQYCADHPDMDYIHFWLADSVNSHCECPNCTESPTDYYVMMLNELDEKLTARDLGTKIVFLLYFDLLWAPEKETIRNQDRFVLMFAPITRTYSNSFTTPEEEVRAVSLPPYRKNQLTLPKSVAENVAFLRKWQQGFGGDSFDFDYHMMWDHYNDPGSMSSARLLHEDMKNLVRLGLRGMNSCQVQRAFFPTSMNMITMAETLWNREVSFEDIATRYFAAAFGEDGDVVRQYLERLSRQFDPVWQRGERPVVDAEQAGYFAEIPAIVDRFRATVYAHMSDLALSPAVRRSWEYLTYHADACVRFASACRARAEGKQELAAELYRELLDYFHRVEPQIHPVFDPLIFDSRMGKRFAKPAEPQA